MRSIRVLLSAELLTSSAGDPGHKPIDCRSLRLLPPSWRHAEPGSFAACAALRHAGGDKCWRHSIPVLHVDSLGARFGDDVLSLCSLKTSWTSQFISTFACRVWRCSFRWRYGSSPCCSQDLGENFVRPCQFSLQASSGHIKPVAPAGCITSRLDACKSQPPSIVSAGGPTCVQRF